MYGILRIMCSSEWLSMVFWKAIDIPRIFVTILLVVVVTIVMQRYFILVARSYEMLNLMPSLVFYLLAQVKEYSSYLFEFFWF